MASTLSIRFRAAVSQQMIDMLSTGVINRTKLEFEINLCGVEFSVDTPEEVSQLIEMHVAPKRILTQDGAEHFGLRKVR